jgi:hypothetical protein
MFPLHLWPMRLVVAAVTGLSLSAPCIAFEKYLPDKTEAVLGISVGQVVEAPPIKNHAPGLIKEYCMKLLLLANQDSKGMRKLIEDNPGVFQPDVAASRRLLTDLRENVSAVVVAGTIDDGDDEVLVIVQGRFDAAKVKKLIESIGSTKFLGLSLKTHRVSGRDLYEFNFPNGEDALFFALADEQHLLFTQAKDMALEAMAKAAGKRKPKLNKGLATALTQANRKQSLWFVIGPSKDDEVESATGGVRIAADIRMEATIVTKTAEAARRMAEETKDGFAEAGKELKKLAKNQKELAPFVPLLPEVSVTSQGTVVRLKGQIPAAVLDKVLKSLTKER